MLSRGTRGEGRGARGTEGAFGLPHLNSLRRNISVELKTLILLGFLALATPALSGLEKYSSLVKADPSPAISAPPRRGVRITYLGTNGYLFESRGVTLLVDPYFSRQSLFRMAFKLRPVPRNELIAQWLRDHPKIDAILVTHGHVDHLYDAPQILRQTRATLIASPTSVKLVESLGVPANQTRPVLPGRTVSVKNAVIRVLPAQHDRLFGSVPFDGPLQRLPPQEIEDWVTGVPLAFLIEMGGKRIFINSGGRPNDVVATEGGRSISRFSGWPRAIRFRPFRLSSRSCVPATSCRATRTTSFDRSTAALFFFR